MAFIPGTEKEVELIIHQVASMIKIFREADRSGNKRLKQWAKSTVDHACRQLEIFISPEVSVKAAKLASDRGYSLKAMRWPFQDYAFIEGEKKKKQLHWEHVLPISCLRSRLMEVQDLENFELIKKVFLAYDIAWITKEENEALDRNKYRKKRPENPWEAYKNVGIDIVGKSWGTST